MTMKSTVENDDNGEVTTKAMEGSVYEITKDLREVETKESAAPGNGGIDWNWDGETDDKNNNDDENDSDATSVMLSSEDEAEEEGSGDIECGSDGNDGDEKMDHNDGATSTTTFSAPPVDSKTNTESSSNDAVEKTSRKDEDHYNGKGKEDYSSKNDDDDFPFNDNDEDDADDELSVGGDGPIHDADQPLLDEDDDEAMLETTQPSTVGEVASGNDDEEVATEGDDDDDDSIVANASSGKKQDKSKTKGKKGKRTNKSSVVVKKKGKKRKEKQPDLDDLLRSTDVLFELADDKNAVKVSEINESLEVEYDCQLSKANKKTVRAHLTDLINRKDEVNDSQQSEDAESEASDDDDEKPKTTRKGRRYTKSGRKNKKLSKAKAASDDDLDESDDESATSLPANESESEASDDDEDKTKTSTRKGRKQMKKLSRKRQGSSKTDDLQESDDESSFGQPDESESEASDNEEGEKPKTKRKGKKQKKVGKKKITKPKPLSKRKAAKAARLIQAERLRKKRMEELRIRNEEMQLNISKEERERSEKIAARFDTDTDELRAKRLEDRLNLLQALDKKRFEVVEIKDEPEKGGTTPELGDEKKAEEGSDSEEESSDDEDLEIVGVAKPLKPMKPIHTHFQSKALDVLKKLRSPDGQKTKTRTKTIISPGTSNMNARNALRSKLKERQRTAGNRWLARELGYKTEQEHLKDCQTAVNQKREQVIKFEQLRLKVNERKQLRERMLLADDEAPADEDEREEEFKPGDTPAAADEEENEELRLARQIEQENDKVESVSEPTSVNYETTQGPPGIADTEQIEETVDESQDMFDESQRLETQPTLDAAAPRDTLVSKVSAEESDTGDAEGTEKSLDEDVFDESQRLETQPSPDIPVIDSFTKMTPRIVSAESEDSTSESHQANDDTSSGGTTRVEKSAETTAPTSKLESDDDDEPEEELEFVDNAPDASVEAEGTVETARESNKPRNAGWQAMLKREAEKLKKQKKRRNAGDLFEEEAEEEEEEEVAGLEDFGFSVKKKDKNGDDEEDKANDDDLDEEDLKHIVDELSDDEGDEEAGRKARKRQQEREEKERHKDMLRRMREGYDGRRGGIAGGAGARGLHRFDQLVAADNREDAKRLGLLNDDEMDSDEDEEKKKSGDNDDEEDENVLLDKMLKDRFLHRSSNVDLEEQFSDSDEEENPAADNDPGNLSEEEEERTQERLARRFAKRARMQRLEEMYSESQEFSQQRMIDEDESMKIELQSMKNGLLRKRSVSSSRSSFSEQQGSNLPFIKRQRSSSSSTATFGGSFMDKNGSLSVALRASRKTKQRTSFLGGAKVGDSNNKGASGFVHRSVSLNRVVFHQSTSRSSMSNSNLVGKGGNVGTGKRKERPGTVPTSLFSKVAGRG